MGLDMYLEAERRMDVSSADGQVVLALLGGDEGGPALEEDGGIYLPRWSYVNDDNGRRNWATSVVEAAGLLPFAAEANSSGSAWMEDGQLVVELTAVYWRKANAVHSWFVQNCQGGVDECQRTGVEAEQLAHLRSCCLDALTAYRAGDLSKAAEIMTPTSGFFFGGTDVDEYWAQDLEHTAASIERVVRLAVMGRGRVSFAYRASW